MTTKCISLHSYTLQEYSLLGGAVRLSAHFDGGD